MRWTGLHHVLLLERKLEFVFSDFCHGLKEWKARNGLQNHQILMSCGRVYEVCVKFCRVVLFDWSPYNGFTFCIDLGIHWQ